jgi:hypothetical protein
MKNMVQKKRQNDLAKKYEHKHSQNQKSAKTHFFEFKPLLKEPNDQISIGRFQFPPPSL